MNNRRLSESPDNKSQFNGLLPSDQWLNRNNQLSPTSDNHLRPLAPNSYQTFGPTFSNQRLFTPRSSYFGQQNNLLLNTSAVNMNQNFNYGSNYPNYDYNSAPNRVHPSYDMMDTNRPVYSTDLSNISLDMEDINQLKKALINANQTTEMSSEKSNSPESTVSSADSTPNSMDKLIHQMKRLTDEEKKIKKTRRDVEKKIIDLDEELKVYEKKLQLRDNLKKIKSDLERDEEELGNKIQKVVTNMEKINKITNSSSIDSNDSVVEKTKTKIDSNLKRVETPVNNNSVPKPALKRPNPSVATKFNSVKKVRINSEVSDSSGGTTNINTTPKVSTKPVIKRTPIPSKLSQSSDSTPEMNTSKISRICRQQTPHPTTTGVTSGVRTSRPQKMMSSRSNRFVTTAQTPELLVPKPLPKPLDKPSDTPQKKSDSIEPESDNEVFKELEKLSSKIDLTVKPSNDNSVNINQISVTTVPKECDTQKIEDRVDKQLLQTNDDPIDDKVFEENQSENVLNPQKSAPNVRKNVEILDMGSDDEDLLAQEVSPKLEQINCELKKEMTDSIENLNFETKPVTDIKEMPKLTKEESFDTNEDHNSSKDSPFKVPTEPVIVKKQHKYCGFDAIYYEPTVNYSISSFKAIAGPKSKTVATSIIFLKSFKDYLFASFMDSSVRRFHIEDKNNVIKYEGHEGLVLALIVFECPKNANTFILYTGGKDRKLRAFNAITGQILNSIDVYEEINCIIFNWGHIFCALNDGNVCKIPTIHEINDNSIKIKRFAVNLKKRIQAIVALKTVDPPNNDFEAVIAISINKLRIVNTKDSVSDEHRILDSFPVHFSIPMFMRTFGSVLIISYKIPAVKNEDKTKKEDRSKILMYDLKEGWNPIKSIEVNGLITCLDLCKEDLIVSCFSGTIQCIDCQKLELKWISYASRVTACVKIGDRLVLGNDQGLIDVIYLDQTFLDCGDCGVTFARQIDFKKHIQTEHKVSDTPNNEEITQK